MHATRSSSFTLVPHQAQLNFRHPLPAEMSEPLARFVREPPKDSNFADEGFRVLKIRNFSGRLAPITQFVRSSLASLTSWCFL